MPEGSHEVKRYLEGTFLFVLKNSPYNGISGTYDVRHAMASSLEFREYVEYLIQIYLKIKTNISKNKRYEYLSEKEMEHRILRMPFFN